MSEQEARTSIDELLTQEMAGAYDEPAESTDVNDDNDSQQDKGNATDEGHPVNNESSDEYGETQSTDSAEDTAEEAQETDEYGNETPSEPAKTYTEQEVNERINKAVRERLARVERNQQPQQQPTAAQQHQAEQAGFEYDENSSQDWQQQLKSFIRQTTEEMQQETIRQQYQAKELAAQQEFESKIQNGMSRYKDFVDVVGSQPITDQMTLATRGMNDPAAFLYAAAKRAPDDIKRISEISDPYKQIAEMGKLEAKLKKKPMPSKAPKPVGKITQDSAVTEPTKRPMSLDDMLMAEERARRKQFNRR